jgi:hypothetical protein
MPQPKTPAWILSQAVDSVTVQLSQPAALNGVQTDRVTLRAPTVADVRTARKLGNGDDAETELHLFASLAQCAPSDFAAMLYRDYGRVQAAYFRLLADPDGADPAGISSDSAPSGG